MVYPEAVVLPADSDGRKYVSTTNYVLLVYSIVVIVKDCTYMKSTKPVSCAV